MEITFTCVKHRKQFLQDFCQKEFLWQFPKDDLKKMGKNIRSTLDSKYHRIRTPKYGEKGILCPTDEEIHQFFSSFKMYETKYKVCCQVLLFTGRRPNEAVRLHMNDIDFAKKSIWFFQSKKRVEGKMKLALTNWTQTVLEWYTREFGKEIWEHEGYLFFSEQKNASHPWMSPDELRNKWSEVRSRAGLLETYGNRESRSNLPFIPAKLFRFMPRTTRNWFINYLDNHGADLRAIMYLVGHTDPKTTETYLSSSRERAMAILRTAQSADQKPPIEF